MHNVSEPNNKDKDSAMTAWIKGNKLEISLVLVVIVIVGIVKITLVYAERQEAQNFSIEKNTIAIAHNSKELGELTEAIKKHVESANMANQKVIKMESDVDHIKKDIEEIKTILREK